MSSNLTEPTPPATQCDLKPEDHDWMPWLPRTVLPLSPEVPLDCDLALRTLLCRDLNGNWSYQSPSIMPPSSLFSVELAQYWIEALYTFAMVPGSRNFTVEKFRSAMLSLPRFDDQSVEKFVEFLVFNVDKPYHAYEGFLRAVTRLHDLIAVMHAAQQLLLEPENVRLRLAQDSWENRDFDFDWAQKLAASRNPADPRYFYAKEAVLKFVDWRIAELMGILGQNFRKYIRPYLCEAKVADIRLRLRQIYSDVAPTSGVPNPHHAANQWLFLAAALDMHAEVEAALCHIPDGTWLDCEAHTEPGLGAQLLFALPTPEKRLSELRRLNLRMHSAQVIRICLASTGAALVDRIYSEIINAPSEQVDRLVNAFSHLKSVESVPYMLALRLTASPSIQVLAQRWLERNPSYVLWGLIPVAAGAGTIPDKVLVKPMIVAAQQWLQTLCNRGHGEAIQAALNTQPPAIAEPVHRLLFEVKPQLPPLDVKTTPVWLAEALREVSRAKPKPCAWVLPAELPPLPWQQQRLSDEQVHSVLRALSRSTLDSPDPLLVALKSHLNPTALDRFAWQLFQCWERKAYPSKERWAMIALGLLGADPVARQLARRIDQWPGEKHRNLALFGLECLRTIGSDVALLQLHRIALKMRHAPTRNRAWECLNAIAFARGLSAEELEDRLVPTCGLDERSTRSFDFGPRQFQFVLDTNFKPSVRDSSNKMKSDLPKPASTDDPERAKQAIADWKELKKIVPEAAKLQALRLEKAMVNGRLWSQVDFLSLLVAHPLLTHLVQRLVWSAHDQEGSIMYCFRVAVDHSFTDVRDEPCSLEGVNRIGLPHPILLDGRELADWQRLFFDYALVQPFAQLDRPIYWPEPQEVAQGKPLHFQKITFDGKSVIHELKLRGWQFNHGEDEPAFARIYLPYRQTAVFRPNRDAFDDGVRLTFWSNLTDLGNIYYYAYSFATSREGMRLNYDQVHPIVFSETIRDLKVVNKRSDG